VYAWWCKCHGHYSAYISKYLILLIFIHSRTPALTGRSLLQENFGTSAGDGAGNPCAGIARVVVLKTENTDLENREMANTEMVNTNAKAGGYPAFATTTTSSWLLSSYQLFSLLFSSLP